MGGWINSHVRPRRTGILGSGSPQVKPSLTLFMRRPNVKRFCPYKAAEIGSSTYPSTWGGWKEQLTGATKSLPALMLYIMYNMVQRLPAGIRRHLSRGLAEGELHMQHIRRSGHGSSQESSVGGESLASFNTMSLLCPPMCKCGPGLTL